MRAAMCWTVYVWTIPYVYCYMGVILRVCVVCVCCCLCGTAWLARNVIKLFGRGDVDVLLDAVYRRGRRALGQLLV